MRLVQPHLAFAALNRLASQKQTLKVCGFVRQFSFQQRVWLHLPLARQYKCNQDSCLDQLPHTLFWGWHS